LEALRETETALTTYARALDQRRPLQPSRDQAAVAARDADKLFQLGLAAVGKRKMALS
jgi:multidrug efflux system outer membrane protein